MKSKKSGVRAHEIQEKRGCRRGKTRKTGLERRKSKKIRLEQRKIKKSWARVEENQEKQG